MADAADPQSVKGLRDRAILLFGFDGAFRRSELVALNTWNLDEQDASYKVIIDKSKTDQDTQGQIIGVLKQPDSPYCPVQAMKDWLTVAEIERGALFRRMHRGDSIGASRLTAQSIALLVKEHAARVGLDYSRYSGHSLRVGFLTSAAQENANIFKMADQ